MNSTSNPPPPKPVLVFALHALVVSLLLGYWPTPRTFYPEVLRAQAEVVYGGGETAIVFRAADPQPDDARDTHIEAFDGEDADPIWRVSFSAVRMGYWPSAVLLAMLLATPMGAGRRVAASAVGLVWIDAVALGRVGLEILRASEELLARDAEAESDALIALRSGSEVLNSNIVVIAVVFIGWAVVAAPRRSVDVRGLLRLLRPGGGPAT